MLPSQETKCSSATHDILKNKKKIKKCKETSLSSLLLITGILLKAQVEAITERRAPERGNL